MADGPAPRSPTAMDAPSCIFVSPCWLFRGGLRRGLEVLRVAQVDRRVRLERALEIELLGDLADRREDLGAHQPDAGQRILLADPAVIAPQRQDARPGLLEDTAQL